MRVNGRPSIHRSDRAVTAENTRCRKIICDILVCVYCSLPIARCLWNSQSVCDALPCPSLPPSGTSRRPIRRPPKLMRSLGPAAAAAAAGWRLPLPSRRPSSHQESDSSSSSIAAQQHTATSINRVAHTSAMSQSIIAGSMLRPAIRSAAAAQVRGTGWPAWSSSSGTAYGASISRGTAC